MSIDVWLFRQIASAAGKCLSAPSVAITQARATVASARPTAPPQPLCKVVGHVVCDGDRNHVVRVAIKGSTALSRCRLIGLGLRTVLGLRGAGAQSFLLVSRTRNRPTKLLAKSMRSCPIFRPCKTDRKNRGLKAWDRDYWIRPAWSPAPTTVAAWATLQ